MNPRRASIPGKSLRAAAALLGIWIAASSLHAQNTHSAQLIRAQQQYFTAADSPSLNFGSGSLTVKAWVKVNANAANTQDMVILEKRASGDAAYMLYLANGGALYAEAGEGSSGTAAQTVQIDDGVWPTHSRPTAVRRSLRRLCHSPRQITHSQCRER